MAIDFYYFVYSPPCRVILLLAKAIGVHLNLKVVNIFAGDQMKPEFLKINPQHKIPTIDDNGFVLYESRAIMAYLVSKYAKNDSLYPKDPKLRGLVDKMLYFDADRLFGCFIDYYMPVVKGLSNTVREEDVQATERACEVLNAFLEGQDFVAGENLTIADFSVSTTINVLQCFDFDIGRYDNVAAWYERCKRLMEKFGFEEIHKPGTEIFIEMYHANLQEPS